MRIVANHAHLMPPDSWREGDVGMLLRHLDACDIDRCVVFAPFAVQMGDDRRRASRWLLEEVRGEDRLIPFGCIAPAAEDAGEMLHLLVEEGVRGAKVHPSIDLFDVTEARACEFYAQAQEHGFILDFHTGPHGTRLALADPTKFDEVAWNFPDLTMIFEHLGGRTYFELFLAILVNHKARGTLFAGLASVLSAETHPLWHLGPERVTELAQLVGANRLIYGLDFPWNSVETNRRDIAIIQGLDIPEENKEKILGGTLLKLLKREDE